MPAKPQKENDRNDVWEYDELQVHCFPLYSVLMALGNPLVDYLSLDIEGAEFKVLETVPSWTKAQWITIDFGGFFK